MICNSVQKCVGECVYDWHLVPNKLYEYQAQIWGGGGGGPCSASLSAKGSLGWKRLKTPGLMNARHIAWSTMSPPQLQHMVIRRQVHYTAICIVPIYSVLKDTTIRMQLDNFNYTSSHTYIITSYIGAPSPGHSRPLHLPLLDESLTALSEPQDDKVHSTI